MKKAFAAFVAVLLLCLLAGLGQAQNQPRTNENKVRPEITHEFVEQLLQECTTSQKTYDVLSHPSFNKEEWQLIVQYTDDNIQNPQSDTSGQMGKARQRFFHIVQDILGELKYDKIIEGSFIKMYETDSNVDADIAIKLANRTEFYFNVTFCQVILDPRIFPLPFTPTGTLLKIYLNNRNETIKIMVSEKNSPSIFADLEPVTYGDKCPSCLGLTEHETELLRQQMQQ